MTLTYNGIDLAVEKVVDSTSIHIFDENGDIIYTLVSLEVA